MCRLQWITADCPLSALASDSCSLLLLPSPSFICTVITTMPLAPKAEYSHHTLPQQC